MITRRRRMTTGRGPMSTGRSLTTIAPGPAIALPRPSRARHGRLQDDVRPDAPLRNRPHPVHRGQSHRNRPSRGLRRPSRLGGLPVVARLTPSANRAPARSSAWTRARPPRRRPWLKPRQPGPCQPARGQSIRGRSSRGQAKLHQRSSAAGTTARLPAASPPGASAGIPFCLASLAAASLVSWRPGGSW